MSFNLTQTLFRIILLLMVFGSFQTVALAGPKAQNVVRKHLCPVEGCGQKFEYPANLRQHHASVHSGEKPHVCPYDGCDKAFALPGNLNVHKRTHETKPHVCEIDDCGKGFNSYWHLKDHQRRVHPETSSERFASDKQLKAHRAQHQSPKPHQCDAVGCWKSFDNTDSLSRHRYRQHGIQKRHEKRHPPPPAKSRPNKVGRQQSHTVQDLNTKVEMLPPEAPLMLEASPSRELSEAGKAAERRLAGRKTADQVAAEAEAAAMASFEKHRNPTRKKLSRQTKKKMYDRRRAAATAKNRLAGKQTKDQIAAEDKAREIAATTQARLESQQATVKELQQARLEKQRSDALKAVEERERRASLPEDLPTGQEQVAESGSVNWDELGDILDLRDPELLEEGRLHRRDLIGRVTEERIIKQKALIKISPLHKDLREHSASILNLWKQQHALQKDITDPFKFNASEIKSAIEPFNYGYSSGLNGCPSERSG